MTTIEQLLEERADQSHQITLLRDHVRSLQAENAALRKDKERLDYVDATRLGLDYYWAYSAWRTTRVNSPYHQTLRDCLDDAMQP